MSASELGYEESFVRIVDGGRHVTTHKIHGYLPSKIVFFLMNLNVWLRRAVFVFSVFVCGFVWLQSVLKLRLFYVLIFT